MWTDTCKLIFLCLLSLSLAKSEFEIEIKPDSEGEDRRIIKGALNMLWVWTIFSFIFISGIMISIIRDVVPRQRVPDSSDRYFTGENRNILKFMLEEYLLTGWIFTKPDMKFSNTARWSLIFLIIYLEMLLIGIFYHIDPRDQFDSFETRDLLYSVITVLITFGVYLIGYGLLMNLDNDPANFHIYRHYFGYGFLAAVFLADSIFVFVYTYQLQDEHEDVYADLVTMWITAFALALCFECLFSENIRLITRSVFIWRDKYYGDEPIEMNTQERVNEMPRRKMMSFADNYNI